MKRRAIYATAVIVLILSFPTSRIHACEWAIGYFYKVTSLRGTVVGSKFPVLSSFRWFRHAVVRSQATLTLYDYCWPCNLRNLVPVKTAFAGNDGTFDFGNLKPGHYHLKKIHFRDCSKSRLSEGQTRENRKSSISLPHTQTAPEDMNSS